MGIAIWIFVGVCLALWSLAAWGMHTLLTLDPARIGGLKPLLDRVPLAEWLTHWMPGWKAWAQFAIDATQWGLGWIGAAAPAVVWTGWAIGALLLLVCGGVLHGIVAMLRRASATTPAASG